MCLKNVLKNFQMSEQYWGCSDKMSEANFSPAETLIYSGISAKNLFYMFWVNINLSFIFRATVRP